MARQRDDQAHIAVGGILFTVGAGVLTAGVIAVGTSQGHDSTESWFLLLAGCSILLILAGAYMVAAVYLGFPLPPTHRERWYKPDLRIESITGSHCDGDGIPYLLLKVGLLNAGSKDVVVNSNILVPDTVAYIARCDQHGGDWYVGARNTTSEVLPGAPTASIYWQGSLAVPAKTACPVYLRIGLDETAADLPTELPVLAKFWSQDLESDLRVQVTL